MLEAAQAPPRYSSQLMIYDLNTNSAIVVYRANEIWEAPNWSGDGRALLANSNGRLFRIPLAHASAPEVIGFDQSLRCNNDHNFSPDGQLIAISASSPAISVVNALRTRCWAVKNSSDIVTQISAS